MKEGAACADAKHQVFTGNIIMGFLLICEIEMFGVDCWVVKLQADEYDGCFLGVSPSLAVVTNVEWEHVDMFPDEVVSLPCAIPVVIDCLAQHCTR